MSDEVEKVASTRHWFIADDLKKRFLDGGFPDGLLPPHQELRKDYGASPITIDKAIQHLRDDGWVESRKGARRKIKNPGQQVYFFSLEQIVVYLCAERLRNEASEEPTWFFVDLLESTTEALNHRGYQILYIPTNNDPRMEATAIQMLSQRPEVKGFIGIPAMAHASDDSWSFLMRTGKPFLLLDRGVRGLKAPLLTINNVEAGFTAVNHLLESGYRKIFYICERPLNQTTPAYERWRGGFDAVKEWQAEYGADSVVYEYLHPPRPTPYAKAGRTQAQRVISKIRSAGPGSELGHVAIFAINDPVAISAREHLKKSGYNIPEQIGLVSVDNSPISDITGLSTVSQHPTVLAQRGTELLIQWIETGRKPTPKEIKDIVESKHLKPKLMARSTTRREI